jgi:peptidoglycan hydrolase-like protein with peptidoglycan-binding domain
VPRKPAKRGKGPRAAAGAADGLVGRFVDRAFDNPGMSGGLIVMAVTATAIVTNALFLQGHRHPGPLFTPPTEIQALPPVPIPRVRPILGNAPAPEARPTVAAATRPADGDDRAALITSLQRELARLGLYVGPIDGIIGGRTRAAITAYQAAAGLTVTGTPSPELLAFMTTPPPAPDPTATAAVSAAPAIPDPAAEAAAARAAAAELYRRVQTALNLAGYGPIPVDGQSGQQTAEAIRRFELDNGLTITGEVGDRLAARLVAIGAMQAM